MDTSPEEYGNAIVAYVNADQQQQPDIYELPPTPPCWSIGTLNQRVETIMHLAMNTQKAVFKLVLKWASDMDNGTLLRSRLKPLIASVQGLRLPYVPARMFKNAKFGGFVAENYRALTMISPWLFRCLLENEFQPRVIVLPPTDKPRSKWTIKENTAWLRVRGIKVPANIPAVELTDLVNNYCIDPTGPPSILTNTAPTPEDIRRLLSLLFRVFGTLFATDLKGDIAGNRFEALVVQFLDCVQRIGEACHPDKKQPIWLSKYGMLGLLRCRQHFIDYTYLHSLYEGGIEGEGMVKELRPLCPNAVRAGWPLNLMNAFNRQNILSSLTTGFQSTNSPEKSSTFTNIVHEANAKRYNTWADVTHALQHQQPVSMVVLGSTKAWTCHVMVHQFQSSYTKQICILPNEASVDESGFVYHTVTIDDMECPYNPTTPVWSFRLLLPDLWTEEVGVRVCMIDKEWRFVNADHDWTYLG